MAHRRPKWAQSLLNRARHPSCVLVDIIGKARKDNAPIAVKFNGTLVNLALLSVDFDAERRGICISAQFKDAKGAPSANIVSEIVPIAADCILEERVTKLEALRRRIRQPTTQDDALARLGEYCLYFEQHGRRVSAFEFHIDPRKSARLIADHQQPKHSLPPLALNTSALVDSEDCDHTSDFIDSPQCTSRENRADDYDGDALVPRLMSADDLILQFIKPRAIGV